METFLNAGGNYTCYVSILCGPGGKITPNTLVQNTQNPQSFERYDIYERKTENKRR